jgi:autotransporter-associated beta strand protein
MGKVDANGYVALIGGVLEATGSFSSSRTVDVSGGYTNTIAVAANQTLTLNGQLLDFGGGALTVAGPGTLALTNANTYTEGTVIDGGALDLNATTGSLASGSNLSFGGTGTFNYDSTGFISGSNNHQTLDALAFNAGEGTVQSTIGSASSATLSFASVIRGVGATGNFVINGGASGNANAIVIGGQSPGLVDRGIFFNGSSYAAVGANHVVGAYDYSADAQGYISNPNGSPITGTGFSSNVEVTSAITGQTSATMNTLNLGANNVTLGNNQTLTVNGILESGGTATISGGDGIVDGTIADLVVRTNLSTDILNLDTTVSAPYLTKSGAGTLNLNQNFTGSVYLDDGSLGVGHGTTLTGDVNLSAGTTKVNGTVTGNVNVGAGGSVGGSGTVQGKIIVAKGGSTYPGDPQILTVNQSVEYQDGGTAKFAVDTTSPHAVAGTDYDQIKITANTPGALQIDPGSTTLQLNLSAASLAYLQSSANPNDLYFVFNLGSGTSTGQFSDLTLTEGANTYTDAITNGTADFAQLGLDFTLSYNASQLNDSLSGGADVGFSISTDIQSVPEPSTWVMLLGGLGLLAFWRARTRQTLN